MSATAIASGLRIGAPLSAAGGTTIAGIDLSQPLAPDVRRQIRTALLDHHVLVFPDQRLTREQQFAFAAEFGEVERHRPRCAEEKRHGVAHVISNLDANGNPVARTSPTANTHWHTDKPYNPAPPMATLLYAVEMPPAGGATEFANTALAYAALPRAMKQRIAGLRVVFAPKFEADPVRRVAVEHPLVRIHPETGAKALYLGNHAIGVGGMPEAAGCALLDALLDHATRPRFVYRHGWRLGDLVIWDNRCLLHCAADDFDSSRYRRILHRSVVKGSAPF